MICPSCGHPKTPEAFASLDNIGEDLSICRGCRAEARRADNRRMIAAQAAIPMPKLTRHRSKRSKHWRAERLPHSA